MALWISMHPLREALATAMSSAVTLLHYLTGSVPGKVRVVAGSESKAIVLDVD